MALIAEILNDFHEFVTKGSKVINSDHANIHKGYGVITGDYLSLSANQIKSYCFTASSNYPHFKNIKLQALGSSVKIEVLKNATITDNTGPVLWSNNPNDNSVITPASGINEDPTYTGGERMDFAVALSDTTNQFVGIGGISTSENQELVFKPGEQYIITIEELDGGTPTVFWKAFWYDEPLGVS